MATKIRRLTSQKQIVRFKRKKRIRAKIEGVLERPRLSVFRSNAHIYAQLINDVSGCTLAAASSLEADLNVQGKGVEKAKQVGETLARRALEKKILNVVFDRSGYLYHGQLKALAEGARAAGLQF